MAEAAVLAGADPVLDPGVRPVPGFEDANCPRRVLVVNA